MESYGTGKTTDVLLNVSLLLTRSSSYQFLMCPVSTWSLSNKLTTTTDIPDAQCVKNGELAISASLKSRPTGRDLMLFDVDNMTDFANETDLNFLLFFDAPGCIAEPLQET